MATQAPKGTKDVLPQVSGQWQHLEAICRRHAALAGFREIRTPAFEHTELFLRGVGDTTDVVQKEMYTFNDKGNRSITLKPEGTAGVVRALIESGLVAEAMPQKLYYLNCPVFRYENPQSGRLREHQQFGIEAFGSASPYMDIDVVSVAMGVLKDMGLKNLSLNINTIGCPECRKVYHKMLRDYIEPRLSNFCKTCQERFEKNPLRILDCKVDECQKQLEEVPSIFDALCDDCREHFETFKRLLEMRGFKYKVDPRIVRGLDYYTRTVFEFVTEVDGKSLTICGGGRYDGLVKTIGGPALPGVGFGMGMERVLMLAQAQDALPQEKSPYDLYICTMGDRARDKAFELCALLRSKGVRVDADTMGRSLKAQFKYSGKLSVPKVLVIGDDELESGVYKMRDMEKGEESSITQSQLFEMQF